MKRNGTNTRRQKTRNETKRAPKRHDAYIRLHKVTKHHETKQNENKQQHNTAKRKKTKHQRYIQYITRNNLKQNGTKTLKKNKHQNTHITRRPQRKQQQQQQSVFRVRNFNHDANKSRQKNRGKPPTKQNWILHLELEIEIETARPTITILRAKKRTKKTRAAIYRANNVRTSKYVKIDNGENASGEHLIV